MGAEGEDACATALEAEPLSPRKSEQGGGLLGWLFGQSPVEETSASTCETVSDDESRDLPGFEEALSGMSSNMEEAEAGEIRSK